ncbi:MAG: AI-2E family transporter [Pseudomonadales bacterium]|nr:AI-2E family transporter [Pseudomonadales bacterium]MBO6563850.1 AI-2E family transporter [Pseudomonadales bacterium]MBO6596976.1 AI-2E family transporter [Pseudomonadales bacterium]MBO6703618.1 AI-2E family transporter [Pseudomonadales bacterium]MBO6823838.1 AI-2E family transporter [Pseudomonadales bacterium]
MSDLSRPERVLYSLAAIAIVAGALKAASGILVPALLALFIAIVCTDPMYWLIRQGLPKWLAIVLVVVMLLVITSAFPLVISGSYVEFTRELPLYQQRADTLLRQAATWVSHYGYDYDAESIRAVFDPAAALGYVQVVLAALGGILSRYLLIMLLVIFILVDVPQTVNNRSTPAGEIVKTVQHYFAIKTFTSMLTGGLISIWLLILDVQYPLLWGFLAFLLNFVPNIGSVLAAIPAVILSLLFDGYVSALIVMIGYVLINVGVSNGLEPRIMGQQLGLRFVWIFVSLIVWGWILGPVGMLLAVPLTMTLRIALEKHPKTIWIANILVPENLIKSTGEQAEEAQEKPVS